MSSANPTATLTVTAQAQQALSTLDQLKAKAAEVNGALVGGEQKLGELRKARMSEEEKAAKAADAARAKATRDLERQGAAFDSLTRKQAVQGRQYQAIVDKQASDGIKGLETVAATERKIDAATSAEKQRLLNATLSAKTKAVEAEASAFKKNEAEVEAAFKRQMSREAQLAYYRTTKTPLVSGADLRTNLAKYGDQWTASQVSTVEKMLKSRQFLNAWADAGKSAAKEFMAAFAVGAGVAFAGVKFGEGVFKASSELETLRLQMKGVYKDTQLAADQYEAYLKMTKAYGTDPTGAAPGYMRLAASAAGSGWKVDEINDGVQTILKARAAYNLKTEDAYLAMREFGNILSTGKVQARELNSLGFHIPDIMGVFQRATGLSGEKFNEAEKAGTLNANVVVKLALMQLDQEVSRGAAEAQTSVQEAVNRLKTQLKIGMDTIGQGGFNQAINKVATDLMKTLEDPAAAANLKAIGKAMGDMVTWLYDAAKATVGWVKEHKAQIEQWAKWAEIAALVVVSVKALEIGVLGLRTAFELLKSPIGFVLELVGLSLPKAFSNFAASGEGAVSRVTTVVRGLNAMLSGLVAAPFIIEIGTRIHGAVDGDIEHYRRAQNSLGTVKAVGVDKLDDFQVKDNLATLEKGRDTASATLNGWLQGTEAKDMSAAIAALRARKVVIDANTKATKELKDATDAFRVSELKTREDQERERTMAELRKHQFQAPKEKKGGGGNGSSNLAAKTEEEDKARYEAAKEALKLQLDEQEITYRAYYERLKVLRKQELDEDLVALKKKHDGVKLGTKATAAELEAIDKEITTAHDKETKDQLALDDAYRKHQVKVAKDAQKELDQLAAKNEAKYDTGTSAREDELRRKAAPGLKAANELEDPQQRAQMVAALQKELDTEIALLKLGKEERDLARSKLDDEREIAKVKLAQAQNRLSAIDAEQRIFALTKQQAQAELTKLEAMRAEDGLTRDQTQKLDKQIDDLKLKLTEMSPVQKAISDAISSGFKGGIEGLMNQKMSLRKAFLNLFDSVLGSIKNQVAGSLTDVFMQALNLNGQGAPATSSAGKAGNWLGTLVNAGISYFTGGGTSAAGATGGGSMAGLVAGGMSLMSSSNTDWSSTSSLFSSNAAQTGGAAMSPAPWAGGATVVMNVSTPDANSFRASSTQMNMDLSLAASKAMSRNG